MYWFLYTIVPVCAAKQPRSLTGARLGVGACLWDGAFVLTAYIAGQTADTYTGGLLAACSVLETDPGVFQSILWQSKSTNVWWSLPYACTLSAQHNAMLTQPYVAGKRCIELGAGVGLVGLALARLGAQVTLTDKPALLSLLRGNVAKNWLGERPPPGYCSCAFSVCCHLGV